MTKSVTKFMKSWLMIKRVFHTQDTESHIVMAYGFFASDLVVKLDLEYKKYKLSELRNHKNKLYDDLLKFTFTALINDGNKKQFSESKKTFLNHILNEKILLLRKKKNAGKN